MIVCVICDYLCCDIGEIFIDSNSIYECVFEYICLVCLDFVNCVKKYEGEVLLFSYF